MILEVESRASSIFLPFKEAKRPSPIDLERCDWGLRPRPLDPQEVLPIEDLHQANEEEVHELGPHFALPRLEALLKRQKTLEKTTEKPSNAF